MTTKAVNDISVNLEHEAELRILEWRLEVQAIAASLATIVTPTGLLTHVLTDQEWTDHLANRSTSLRSLSARVQSVRFVPSLSARFAVLLDRSRLASLDRSLLASLAVD